MGGVPYNTMATYLLTSVICFQLAIGRPISFIYFILQEIFGSEWHAYCARSKNGAGKQSAVFESTIEHILHNINNMMVYILVQLIVLKLVFISLKKLPCMLLLILYVNLSMCTYLIHYTIYQKAQKQNNCGDCGVFVIEYARNLALHGNLCRRVS